ncbi:hypothetical protein R3I94_021925 [Phoxinus phoxinus]
MLLHDDSFQMTPRMNKNLRL